MQHTSSTLHINRLRKSPFNQYILDLALQISQQAQPEESASLSPNKLQESTERVDSEVEILGGSRKKVKDDSPTASTHPNLMQTAISNVNQKSQLMGWVS